MNKFIKNIAYVIFYTFLPYYTIGIIAEYIINSNIQNNQYQLQEDWHVRHKYYHKYLFVGNSRTYVHVDVKHLSEKLNISSYCLAQNGRNARILFFKLKKYLELNRAPEKIFLQFDPYFLGDRNNGTFYGKENYLGYIFHDRLGINTIFSNELGFNLIEVYLPLKRYFEISNGKTILMHHLLNLKSSDHEKFKYGSDPQQAEWQENANWDNPERTSGNLSFTYIDSVVNICKHNNIQLIFLYPPQSYPSYQKIDDNLLHQLEQYKDMKKVLFWNFNHIKYDDSRLFYNHMHLNSNGSFIYTNDLVDSISTFIHHIN
jgi:hypothetical protein